MLGDPEGPCDQTDLTRREVQGVVLLVQLHQQHKLIATDPRQRVVTAQVFTQARCHLTQQQIAHVMSEGIVDRLEPVQIDEHQGKTAALFLHP
ncbi:hypothetical protein D3C78_1661020 [compost metagenome]